MIKIQRTAWAMSQRGIPNETIVRDLSLRTGRDLNLNTIAASIGRFESRRKNKPEQFFDALLEDCDIQDGEELADILDIAIADADELLEIKELNDEQIILLIDYYDENIAKPSPPPAEKNQPDESEATNPPSETEDDLELVGYATDDKLVRLGIHTYLQDKLGDLNQDVADSLINLAIPLKYIGDPDASLTLEQIQEQYSKARGALHAEVIRYITRRFEAQINMIKNPSHELK